MRLSQKQKEQVLAAALRHVTAPSLVRIGDAWGVVGHDLDEPKTWTGLLVHGVDERDGTVWWTGSIYMQRRRSDVVAHLTAEASS